MLINGKHIIKQQEGKIKEGYMVLELKQKYFMDKILVSLLDLMLRAQHHVQMLRKYRQKIGMASSQPDSPTNHRSTIAPVIPGPAAANIAENRASVFEE
ncbi:hypothetical protein KY290_016963 [Solanum tuberosum]|uniref:Uncharacterized protein n=1 Tax=Solanum tuberosum TaxID=4113 RepID=A0ABQ7V9Y5_SOLTU|nr:hypothetical protein KY284_016038 [Solanum tuberosum]KAH0760890.1 hypothetical protein KY290_016963 [Solanum tuberosum]